MPLYEKDSRCRLHPTGYIENESYRLNIPEPKPHRSFSRECIDSCITYNRLTGNLRQQRKLLEKDSVRLVKVEELAESIPITVAAGGTIAEKPMPDLVSPLASKSLYYQFHIKTLGWHNIDMLIDNIGATESSLTVQIEGAQKASFDIYLAIPSVKVLLPAGKLDQANTYGFYTKDGKIKLPQGVDAYLFAMGEQDTTLYFASKRFTTTTAQQFVLPLTPVSKQVLEQQLAQLTLPDLKMSVNDTKTGQELQQTDKAIKGYDRLKPSGCNCDCLLKMAESATAYETTP